jgi:hypothetical protein
LVRIEENGARTVGRFVNRAFISVPLEEELDANSSIPPQNSESVAA